MIGTTTEESNGIAVFTAHDGIAISNIYRISSSSAGMMFYLSTGFLSAQTEYSPDLDVEVL